MKTKFKFLLFIVFFANSIFAQKGNPEVYKNAKGREPYQQGLDGTILLTIKTQGESIDNCKENAKKQAVYVVIFQGYNTANNIPAAPSLTDLSTFNEKKAEFEDFFKDGGNYSQFTPRAELHPNIAASKIEKKLYEASVNVDVEIDKLRTYLEKAKLIKAANVSSSGYKPNIVILPSDAWMKTHKYKTVKDNQGIPIDVFDYKNGILDGDMKNAIAAVKSKFEKNFKIVNLTEKWSEIALAEAKNNALPVAKRQSELDIYAKTLAADLWLKIDIEENDLNRGLTKQLIFTLEAYDPFSGNNAFSGLPVKKETTSDNKFDLTTDALNGAADAIRPKFTDYFSKRESEGVEGRVTCSIAESAGDLSFNSLFTVNSQTKKLSQVIESVLAKNSKKTEDGVSRITPAGDQTETLLSYKDVFIPVTVMEDEFDLDAEEGSKPNKVPTSNTFGKVGTKLQEGLLSKCNITCDVITTGLGKVEIVITGKK
jgi:hypothetical protein